MPNPPIIGMRVDTLHWRDCLSRIINWARGHESRYACLANVHMAVSANENEAFLRVVNGADLVISDGRPLVWAKRLFGVKQQIQIRGADLMVAVCGMCDEHGLPIGLFGGRHEVVTRLVEQLKARFPRLEIAYAYSPPFRPPTAEETAEIVRSINAARPAVLFVGLGCPRQEVWMAENRPALNTTMLGVGAAFDFLAGSVRQAPVWMQRYGLEWAFRLSQEPARLAKRYAYTNTRFLVLFAKQLLASARL